MHPELEKLVHLQHTEQRLLALTAQIAALPKRTQEREQALASAERELAATLHSLATEEKARKSMELDAEALRHKAARYRAQTDGVQDPSQLQALEHEIGFAEQEIRRIEDAELESMVRSEALEGQQRAQQAAIERCKQQLADEKAAVTLEMEHDEKERAVMQQQRQAVRSTIQEEMLALYDRIAAAHRPAVAEAIGQRCSACQMTVRPQKWNELQNDVLLHCDSCGRLLYYSAPVDVLDAMTGPAKEKKSGRKPVRDSQSTGPQTHSSQSSND
ncbi:MAG: zinc ribbon domain-containing protein [Acidobacteriaceae bacterium]